MKKICIIIIGLILSNTIQSQNYIPLLIDSSYQWTWNVYNGDTVVEESWIAYSYDSNDSLIQLRSPSSIFNYFYAEDTVYLLAEVIDIDNNWNDFRRSATVYETGNIVSRLTEYYGDNGFENSSLYTYYYENLNLDTLCLLQHWSNEGWINFYKKEKRFDENGNNIEEAEYYVDVNDNFNYNTGRLFEYDDANHLIQEISINSSINGEYFRGEVNWVYGNDDLVDTMKRCNYLNNGTCNNVIMITYDYLGQDTIVENRFTWSDDEWQYYGKELTFAGPQIFSGKPDSITFDNYWADSLRYIPSTREYFEYQDLGNDTIYFKEGKYNYFWATNEWLLTRLIEKWYHVSTIVQVENVADKKEHISIFPNPCVVGQNLTIKKKLINKKELEVLIFDTNGRLVSRNYLENESLFRAPTQQGIYTILILEDGVLIGVSKEVIIE